MRELERARKVGWGMRERKRGVRGFWLAEHKASMAVCRPRAPGNRISKVRWTEGRRGGEVEEGKDKEMEWRRSKNRGRTKPKRCLVSTCEGGSCVEGRRGVTEEAQMCSAVEQITSHQLVATATGPSWSRHL